jgi:hypothetical protein
MSPKSFTFKLTVPRDPQALAIVSVVASHAVTYAAMDAATGADFVTRVDAVAAMAIQSPGEATLQIVVTSDAIQLTFAIDATPVSANHSA